MIYCLIKFGSSSKAEKEKAENLAGDYVASLMNNGQIIDNYYLTWMGGVLYSHVFIARPDSLKRQYHSELGKKNLEKITTYFQNVPKWTIKDDDVETEYANWESADFLYLRTHAFENCSPVFRGNDGVSIPLYLIPISDKEREYIKFWADSYYHHDHIWLGSGQLEMLAYKQLADPKSELIEDARDHCKNIEDATGKPTYCYLMRYFGRKKNEENRLCPLCGDKWSIGNQNKENANFSEFHFRCDNCRLVSHLGNSFDDDRHARIGEYKRSKIK
jgi:predicted  nucleic acid-binding Zn ribbon protein